MGTVKSLGSTAIEVWRNWRALPWQNRPCFGKASGLGDFCWQRCSKTPSGMELHRVVNELVTCRATTKEEDRVWDCLLSGSLLIYTRHNRVGGSKEPVTLLHEATGIGIPDGLVFGESARTA